MKRSCMGCGLAHLPCSQHLDIEHNKDYTNHKENQNENKKKGEREGRERERQGGREERGIQLSSYDQFLKCILRLPK